jgi:transcriptional regulator with XRE-family HTH domain
MSKEARKNPLAVRMGRAFQQARRIKDLSQAELAEKLELSVNFVARVERGEAFMSVENLFAAPRILSLSLDELVDDARADWSSELLALAAALKEGERTFVLKQLRATVGTRARKPARP